MGIDDSPFKKGEKGRTLVVGILMRGPAVEGVLGSSVEIDGDDSTDIIEAMISRSRFHPQVKYILLHSVMMGGLNVVDITELSQRLKKPVIAIVRRKPDMKKVHCALSNACCFEEKLVRLRKAGQPVKVKGLYAQFAGMDRKEAEELLSLWKGIPEPIRLAHLVAGGVVRGESRGRA